MAKTAGGPKAPKQQGHWDKDDWKDEPEKQYAVSSVSLAERVICVCECMHEYIDKHMADDIFLEDMQCCCLTCACCYILYLCLC